MRTSKNIQGVGTVSYVYENGLLQKMDYLGYIFTFSYDAGGNPIGFKLTSDDTEAYYYYGINSRGDIIALYDASGAKVATYSYDTYGKFLGRTYTASNISYNDTVATTYNPLRYRGYVYDTDTGFYYLQSRYYDPTTCRFINADGQLNIDSFNGFNMFAYCNGNPVMMADPNGTYSALFSGLNEQFNELVKKVVNTVKYILVINNVVNLTEDQKIVISTVSGEANTTGYTAREAVANVIMNRVDSREWSDYKTAGDICKYTGFDAYGKEHYMACYTYLDNRDFSNEHYEGLIKQVLQIYYGITNDITGGCQLFYTPASMDPPGSIPNWDFDILTEVTFDDVDPYYDFRFFKYQ